MTHSKNLNKALATHRGTEQPPIQVYFNSRRLYLIIRQNSKTQTSIYLVSRFIFSRKLLLACLISFRHNEEIGMHALGKQ